MAVYQSVWFLYSLIIISYCNAANIVVVTCLYDAELRWAENLLRRNFPVILYGNSSFINQLQANWPRIAGKRIYIDRPQEEFLSQSILFPNEDVTYPYILSIEKIFMISNAIYSNFFGNTTSYAWVDIDTINDVNLLPLLTGFPDSRKVNDVVSKIIITSTNIPLQSSNIYHAVGSCATLKGITRSEEIEWLHTRVLVGGAKIWDLVRSASVELLLESVSKKQSNGVNFIDIWWEMLVENCPTAPLRMAVMDHYRNMNLTSTTSDSDVVLQRHIERNLFWRLLFKRARYLFCTLPGYEIKFSNVSLPSELLGLYQLSYNVPMTTMVESHRCLHTDSFVW